MRSTSFPSAKDDLLDAELSPASPQTLSSAYRLAYADTEFMLRDELRPVRLQLELLKPELAMTERGIRSTVVVFGGARIPEPDVAKKRLADAEAAHRESPSDEAREAEVLKMRRLVERSRYYDEARRLGFLISTRSKAAGDGHLVVVTGGGPGIMEAANRGAHDAEAESVSLNIVLPFEQKPNDFVTPELSFLFHYFAIRKMHFLMRARALVVFPGGFGTLDELFETLTLIQTKKIKPLPVLIFGRDFWERVINFEALVEEGTISPDDVRLFSYVETADEAWAAIKKACGIS